jgi:hypothetical protein
MIPTDEDAVLRLLCHRPGLSVGDLAFSAGWVSRNKYQPLKAKAHRALRGLEEKGLAGRAQGKWSATRAGKEALRCRTNHPDRCETQNDPASAKRSLKRLVEEWLQKPQSV